MTGFLVMTRPGVKFLSALLGHLSNLREPLRILFEQFATDRSVVIYGDPSPELLENARTGGVGAKIYS